MIETQPLTAGEVVIGDESIADWHEIVLARPTIKTCHVKEKTCHTLERMAVVYCGFTFGIPFAFKWYKRVFRAAITRINESAGMALKQFEYVPDGYAITRIGGVHHAWLVEVEDTNCLNTDKLNFYIDLWEMFDAFDDLELRLIVTDRYGRGSELNLRAMSYARHVVLLQAAAEGNGVDGFIDTEWHHAKNTKKIMWCRRQGKKYRMKNLGGKIYVSEFVRSDKKRFVGSADSVAEAMNLVPPFSFDNREREFTLIQTLRDDIIRLPVLSPPPHTPSTGGAQ